MGRPACANPANIHHVVKPYPDNPTGRYCQLECVCGEIVSGFGADACGTAHKPHADGCTCEITPSACIDCDAEFVPVDPDDGVCADCIAALKASAEQGGTNTAT